MRRTLLTAGVFALLAMIYVPTPAQRFVHPGYRFIFSSEDTSIAFFQLLLNVVFAGLLGAILATIMPKIVTGVRRLPKWVWRGIGGIALIGLFSVGALAWWKFTEAAQRDERYANELLRGRHDVFDQAVAEFHFRNAARNWRLALRFDEATRVENRIKGLQQRPGQGFTWADEAPQAPGQPGPWEDFQQAPAQAPQAPARNFGFVPDPSPTPKKHISFDPNSAEPIPRARPVKKSMFDDLIPARTATPRR
jgi:hypothetical protein